MARNAPHAASGDLRAVVPRNTKRSVSRKFQIEETCVASSAAASTPKPSLLRNGDQRERVDGDAAQPDEPEAAEAGAQGADAEAPDEAQVAADLTDGSLALPAGRTPNGNPISETASCGERTRISSRILKPFGRRAARSSASRRTRKKPVSGSLTPRKRRGNAMPRARRENGRSRVRRALNPTGRAAVAEARGRRRDHCSAPRPVRAELCDRRRRMLQVGVHDAHPGGASSRDACDHGAAQAAVSLAGRAVDERDLEVRVRARSTTISGVESSESSTTMSSAWMPESASSRLSMKAPMPAASLRVGATTVSSGSQMQGDRLAVRQVRVLGSGLMLYFPHSSPSHIETTGACAVSSGCRTSPRRPAVQPTRRAVAQRRRRGSLLPRASGLGASRAGCERAASPYSEIERISPISRFRRPCPIRSSTSRSRAESGLRATFASTLRSTRANSSSTWPSR